MTSAITTTESATKLLSTSSTPIIATLRSSTCIFEVRCEVTGEWLSPAYNTFIYGPGKEQEEWRETLKKVEYQFYKVTENNNTLWITPPVGFWLKDGRLVSPKYEQGERVKAYYGTEAEIVGKRSISFIKDGIFTFLPEKDFKNSATSKK